MQIPITAGELCRRPANGTGTTEVIVNRRFAERHLAGRQAVGMHLVANSPDSALSSAVRLKLNEFEPLRSVYDVAPLDDRIGDACAENRLRTVVLGALAVTALVLACLGIYGTLGYVVGLRRREIGLHLALGSAGSSRRTTRTRRSSGTGSRRWRSRTTWCF